MLENIADRYLSERIEPLTEDVASRWKLLFGTEGLTLGPGGEITLRRGNIDLELQDMSGGERAIANVIVRRSEEHTSELQSLMRISYAVFSLKQKKTTTHQ